MKLNRDTFAIALVVAIFGSIWYFMTHIPSGHDADLSNEAAMIIGHGYPFDNRADVERTGMGKIFYVKPFAGGGARFDFYGITSETDIALILSLARRASTTVDGIKYLDLRFYAYGPASISATGGVQRETATVFRELRVP